MSGSDRSVSQSTTADHGTKAAERFDGWADLYGDDRVSQWFAYYQRLALAQLPLDEGSWFLDVGCGTGVAVREAANKVGSGKACGVDISPKMLAKARRLSDSHTNAEYKLANSESIPYADATFASVLCTFSFHHYANPIGAIREIRRVLKPGGTFVLVDPARNVSLPILLQDVYRRLFEKSHVAYYTTSEMRQFFDNAGWPLENEIRTFKKFMQLGKLFTGLMLVVQKN